MTFRDEDTLTPSLDHFDVDILQLRKKSIVLFFFFFPALPAFLQSLQHFSRVHIYFTKTAAHIPPTERSGMRPEWKTANRRDDRHYVIKNTKANKQSKGGEGESKHASLYYTLEKIKNKCAEKKILKMQHGRCKQSITKI